METGGTTGTVPGAGVGIETGSKTGTCSKTGARKVLGEGTEVRAETETETGTGTGTGEITGRVSEVLPYPFYDVQSLITYLPLQRR